eukprot:NODE_2018_length_1157_cov_413.999029_g2001_i0.p2 GENE.NODE_2018_length_1157_cov_413.999029_g2001_i0~~NODE_2018_length_1157_cov_413.999029_g2001_i0.p2  ORF type:complete len:326 (-),score=101.05 NODE_2018_length_1157_cov_413.999029_g2001_i0:105-1082(-)
MMRVALIAVALGLAVASQERFNLYKNLYAKQYISESEEMYGYSCFMENEQKIAERNARGAETHGWNHFTDICASDFKKMYHNLDGMWQSNLTGHPNVVQARTYTDAEIKAAADSVDWRSKGAVTPVKNQAQCGSCWSFSATGAMEGVWFLAGNTLVGLSEEELVQCAKTAGSGCQGGWMDKAIEWVVNNGGIDSESDYPYTSGTGITGMCKTEKKSKVVAKFKKVVEVGHSEAQMATYLAANGPVSIGVDAEDGWQTYTGGIMKNCNGRQIDHGVLAVGYGEEGSTPYWIVKNSWARSWGEEGYIRLEKGTNQCGLDSVPCSATA